jgi:hypothetical protein
MYCSRPKPVRARSAGVDQDHGHGPACARPLGLEAHRPDADAGHLVDALDAGRPQLEVAGKRAALVTNRSPTIVVSSQSDDGPVDALDHRPDADDQAGADDDRAHRHAVARRVADGEAGAETAGRSEQPR